MESYVIVPSLIVLILVLLWFASGRLYNPLLPAPDPKFPDRLPEDKPVKSFLRWYALVAYVDHPFDGSTNDVQIEHCGEDGNRSTTSVVVFGYPCGKTIYNIEMPEDRLGGYSRWGNSLSYTEDERPRVIPQREWNVIATILENVDSPNKISA